MASEKRRHVSCSTPAVMRIVVLVVLLLTTTASSAAAQASAGQPITLGPVAVSGSLRTRAYSWDWFGDGTNGDYMYPGSLGRLGFSQSKKRYDWQLELAVPFVLDLPSDAVAPGAAGQLGLGATYFAANTSRRNAAALFIKQGAVRFKSLGGPGSPGNNIGQSLKLGRMEFNDGTEVVPKNATLAALKRDRISQRLLGNFGFSDVGRSIDGALYIFNSDASNVTLLGGRPTQGVFQVDGWGELNVNVFYGAWTRQLGGRSTIGEWRVFGLGYHDYRDGVLKTDNRPLAARRADTESIRVVTYGGHYLRIAETAAGPVDVLGWGALQTGSWGTLAQRAGAFAAEVGWQPTFLQRLGPWIRGGYDYGSGDSDATDETHGTFLHVLPTPRVYARFPFFNMMNCADAFGELLLRPGHGVTVRTDVHALRLADANDLWYSGGGAFQPATFGYTGRPSNGQSGLATLYDVSGDYAINPHLGLGVYYGYAAGKPVTQAIYPTGDTAHFGYVELLLRF